MNEVADNYVTGEEGGDGWRLLLGDSCERLGEIADDSVDLAIYSPPFASLYTYSPSVRDLGNSASRSEFFTHFGFIIGEMLRVTKPGRLNAVHVQQLTTTKSTHGVVGLTDFRGEVIRAYIEAGWVFHGEITIDKDPQAQAIRTKAQALMFVQKNKDSAKSRPALADYVLLFRKPGEIEVPVKTDVSNDEWIQYARPIWRGDQGVSAEQMLYAAAAEALRRRVGDSPLADSLDTMAGLTGPQRILAEPAEAEGLAIPDPCWYDIRESDTLNVATARDQADERHICPLQLPLIERCVRLWSNPGETVLTPFAGIGSEVYTAVRLGRVGVGIELKPSYFRAAVTNVRRAAEQGAALTLFEVS